MSSDWREKFGEVYEHGLAAWDQERKSPASMFTPEETAFLAGIGCTAQELFDFVDDNRRYGEPDFETALEVAAIRQDYFQSVLHSRATGRTMAMEDLPAKTAVVDGLAWLPRLIAKARAKLRGEMPADLMYGCGGDRQFLRDKNMSLPEFLRLVRDCGDEDRRIIDTLKKTAGLA